MVSHHNLLVDTHLHPYPHRHQHRTTTTPTETLHQEVHLHLLIMPLHLHLLDTRLHLLRTDTMLLHLVHTVAVVVVGIRLRHRLIQLIANHHQIHHHHHIRHTTLPAQITLDTIPNPNHNRKLDTILIPHHHSTVNLHLRITPLLPLSLLSLKDITQTRLRRKVIDGLEEYLLLRILDDLLRVDIGHHPLSRGVVK
jgi:hypothetical protein